MHAILGVAILAVAGNAVLGLARPSPAAYRVGPWPGVTGRGAAVLLVCGWMLVGCELVLGKPQSEARAVPDLALLAVLNVVPPLVATTLMRAPGCASAVCGVYLLGRSLASVVDPRLELPPLLLPGAVACDLAAWLQRDDLTGLRRRGWRRRDRSVRRLTPGRAAAGGLAFSVVLALVEPPFAVLLGSDPSGWSASQDVLAGGLAALGCAMAGAGLERITNRLRAAA